MAKIKKIYAHEILDTRAIPTIESIVELTDGARAYSSVPSGMAKTQYEACELRDNDKSRYGGMGVLKAVGNVNTIIASKLIGLDANDQRSIDNILIELDGTQNKERLGANTILSVSQAVTKAAASSNGVSVYKYLESYMISKPQQKKIPTPLFNFIEGGKHMMRNNSFQELLVIPASNETFEKGLEMTVIIYHVLRELLFEKGLSTLVAEEGGFAPQASSNHELLSLLKQAIDKTPYKLSLNTFIGIDASADSLRVNDVYKLADRSSPYKNDDLLSYYESLVSDFSVIYLEDPFAIDDVSGWKDTFQKLSAKTIIVADEFISTNILRLQSALDNNFLNGIVVKPNQIGTVMETIVVCEIAKHKNLKIVLSGRSGETDDSFLADLSVAIQADYVKFGAPARERIIKYNRLLNIEKELKSS